MSGGVALNSACNGKLRKKAPFEKIWIQPAASDAGCSLGATKYLYHQVLGNERDYVMNDVFLGPGYTDEEIKEVLDREGADYEKLSYEKLIDKTASLLKNDKVVSWYQGRLEWGPRALGNRSILANPRKQENMDRINQKVKHREEFRPFAPSVLEDEAENYFDISYESPYMLFVFKVLEEKRDEIPAVTHVNGTARIRTVNREQNKKYYDLIEKFGQKTGTPCCTEHFLQRQRRAYSQHS